MPSAPRRVCNKCRQAVPAGQPCACSPRKPWASNNGYAGSGTPRRQQRMAKQQLREHPICQWPGCRRLATQADHIKNVGAGGQRYDRTNLQSLCKPHHDAKTQSEAYANRWPDEPPF